MTGHIRITGLGFICSIGNSRKEVAHSLQNGISGLGPFPHVWSSRNSTRIAGTLEGFDLTSPDRSQWTYPDTYDIPRTFLRGCAPHALYAYHALKQALADAGIGEHSDKLRKASLYCASAGSPMMLHHYIDQMKQTEGRRVDPLGILSSISGTLNFSLGAHFGIEGGNCGFVSACTSSAHAIGYALNELQQGRNDTAIVVAAEDLTAESLLPFSGMRALSTRDDPRASRPFDRDRDGLVPTGGAVALILEKTTEPAGYATLSQWAHTSDGYDMAISHPEGKGLHRAMVQVIRQAALAPKDIDYINAHATSTKRGDLSEIHALLQFLGNPPAPVPISSTKGITGHGLSMSGAMEVAFCALMLNEQFIAGNPHLDNPAPEAAPLNLPVDSKPAKLMRILSSSSGFGGSNVCILMEKT